MTDLDPCGYPEGVTHPHVEQCHRAERATILHELEQLADTHEIRRLTIERDHWKTVAQQRGYDLDLALERCVFLLDKALAATSAVERVRELVAEWDRGYNSPSASSWAKVHADRLRAVLDQ